VNHVLCCDCDECLNGAGGYVLPGAGATYPDPEGVGRRQKPWFGLSWARRTGRETEQQERTAE